MKRQSIVGQLVLLALGVELLIFAAFTNLQLPTPTHRNIEHFTNQSIQNLLGVLPERFQIPVLERFPVLQGTTPDVRYNSYVPLAPVALFLGYVLGVPLGMAATVVFFFLGLIGPYVGFMPFAAGGGIRYYQQPSFGYLLGLTASAWVSGRITSAGASSLRQLGAVAGGLFAFHATGLLYLMGACLGLLLFEGDKSYVRWQPWLFESIRNLSWYTLPYDVIFSLALIGVAYPFRWLTSVLTAPDIGVRQKPKWDRKLEQVS